MFQKAEWEEAGSYQRALYTFRENLPLLRGDLLNKLLQNHSIPSLVLTNKLQMLNLPFTCGDLVGMFVVRLEKEFDEFNDYERSLMEYAISNIAMEIFGDSFHMWHCKDSYDYLIFIIKTKKQLAIVEQIREIERHAALLIHHVNAFLKRNIIVCVFQQLEIFPVQLSRIYQICLSAIRRHNGSNSLITVKDEPEQAIKGSLQTPYQPPLLIHLLEVGRWSRVADKLDEMLAELKEKWSESPEYANELLMIVSSAFHYFAHKNSLQLGKVIGDSKNGLISGSASIYSPDTLRNWVYDAMHKLRNETDKNSEDSRSFIVNNIHKFIDENVAHDLSLQAIANHLNLHPAYVSQMYKSETGIGLGEYVLKYRMELAANLLQNSTGKIYEIASQTGYLTTHYFIRLFKNHYGVTPQEYREKFCR